MSQCSSMEEKLWYKPVSPKCYVARMVRNKGAIVKNDMVHLILILYKTSSVTFGVESFHTLPQPNRSMPTLQPQLSHTD